MGSVELFAGSASGRSAAEKLQDDDGGGYYPLANAPWLSAFSSRSAVSEWLTLSWSTSAGSNERMSSAGQWYRGANSISGHPGGGEPHGKCVAAEVHSSAVPRLPVFGCPRSPRCCASTGQRAIWSAFAWAWVSGARVRGTAAVTTWDEMAACWCGGPSIRRPMRAARWLWRGTGRASRGKSLRCSTAACNSSRRRTVALRENCGQRWRPTERSIAQSSRSAERGEGRRSFCARA